MGRPPDRDKYASAFGKALDEQLTRSSMSQSNLADAMNASRSVLNRMMTGKKPVPPRWADLVSDVLNLDPAARTKIHAAAAASAGYKVLPEPEKKG